MGLIGFLDCAILPKLGVLMMICFLFYMIRSISCFLKSLSLCACSKRYIFNKSTFARTKLEFSNVFLPTIDRQEHCNHCLFTEVILGPKSKADPKVIQDYLRNERRLDVTVSKSSSSLR